MKQCYEKLLRFKSCPGTHLIWRTIRFLLLRFLAYEYIPDSEIASVAVDTNLVAAKSVSEEDLLEKVCLKSCSDKTL